MRSLSRDIDESGPCPRTPDEKYFAVRGRPWRLADPGLAPRSHERLVRVLMMARRAGREAKFKSDPQAPKAARPDVDRAKRARL
jgi:hypothetical protein